jgi:hypothetical protein
MDKTKPNPLNKHFRQPAIYLRLPSKGAYWPEEALSLPASNELPVYPMTMKDEITLRTPDALLNGEGMVSVIQSCCPSIKDAWMIPSVDVDAILVAIRIASYGGDMDANSKCPNCQTDNMHTLDLNGIMDRFLMPNYNRVVDAGDLKIKLRPQPYFSVNRNNMIMFEEQRLLQAVTNEDLSEEERTRKFNEHMDRLVDLNLEVLTDSTDYILTPDGEKVDDRDFIKDFYVNAESSFVKKVRDRLEEIQNEAKLPQVKVLCESCDKEYEMNVTFDYSSFFDQGS